jgi:hypothetical protein
LIFTWSILKLTGVNHGIPCSKPVHMKMIF